MPSSIASQLISQLRTSSSVTNSSESLKQGQLVGGKVIKLYPGQRALLQMGNKQMTAQLEASLSLNQRYVFQVQSTNPLLRLKVMEGDKGKTIQSPQQLLHQLGFLSPSKTQLTLMKQLIQQNIPFQMQDLKTALHILEQSGSPSKSIPTLLELFSRKMPVKMSVFQALYTRQSDTQPLTSSLHQMQEGLSKISSPGAQALSQSIQQTLGQGRGEPFSITQLIRGHYTRSVHSQETTLNLLNRMGLTMNETGHIRPSSLSSVQALKSTLTEVMNQTVDVSSKPFLNLQQQIRSMQSQYRTEGTDTLPSRSMSILQQLASSSTPNRFVQQNHTMLQEVVQQLNQLSSTTNASGQQVSDQEVINRLNGLLQNQLPISQSAKQSLQQLAGVLGKLTSSEQLAPGLKATLLSALSQLSSSVKETGVQSSLRPLLLSNGASLSSVHSFENVLHSTQMQSAVEMNRASLQEVTPALKHVMDQQVSKGEAAKLVEWLHQANESGKNPVLNLKDAFYVKFKALNQMIGLNYEHQLFEKGDANTNSLKGQVLQAIQDSSLSPLRDRLQTVLSHLNGMPIMMSETDQSIQFNLQMPGEWFGIEQDMMMDIEGRKDHKGEIDPDYCHILFYLELQALKETVIDMRVQKRVVQLTLFTETPGVEALMKTLKPSLEAGLERLNYTLSTIRHKSIDDPVKPQHSQSSNHTNNSKSGGFDLKI